MSAIERTENFASPGGAALDKPRMYELPARLRLNEWALSGDWTVKKEAAVLNKANGRIAYRFHARDLHLVMGPAAPGTSVRFRVLIDGQPPGAAHGSRRRRARQRHGDRTAAVPADPATEAHRRSTVRDRVSRSGRGGFCVHVRLIESRPLLDISGFAVLRQIAGPGSPEGENSAADSLSHQIAQSSAPLHRRVAVQGCGASGWRRKVSNNFRRKKRRSAAGARQLSNHRERIGGVEWRGFNSFEAEP